MQRRTLLRALAAGSVLPLAARAHAQPLPLPWRDVLDTPAPNVQLDGIDNGNLLFNVGPQPDGLIEARQVERLKNIALLVAREHPVIPRVVDVAPDADWGERIGPAASVNDSCMMPFCQLLEPQAGRWRRGEQEHSTPVGKHLKKRACRGHGLKPVTCRKQVHRELPLRSRPTRRRRSAGRIARSGSSSSSRDRSSFCGPICRPARWRS